MANIKLRKPRKTKDARILELLQENANLKKEIQRLFLEIEGLKLELGIS